MSKKFNQKLLNEEIKRHRMISEYSFYTEDENPDDDLILGGDISEVDEETPNDSKPDADSTTPTDDGSAGSDAEADDMSNMFSTDDGSGTQAPPDPTTDPNAPPMDPNSAPAPETAPLPPAQPVQDPNAVDVDVTELVKGSEDATHAAMAASHKTSELLAKFNDLERRVSSINSITNKIDSLEREIVKRNPTPNEKLEMRSLDSFPYSIKLSDYWKDVEGYDPLGSEPKQAKDYILKKGDIDSSFMDTSIKKSFDTPDEYEEEDIDEK